MIVDACTAPETVRGRSRELETLRVAAERAVAGEASIVLLDGLPGIGKSTVVDAIRVGLGGMLDRVLTVRCSPFDTSPHEPLDRIADLIGRPRPTLPLVAVDGPERAAAPSRARNAERRAAAAMADEVLAAARAPTMLLIEDLHWAGRCVLDFVELLVDELLADADHPIIVVLVTRPLPPGHETETRLDRLAHEGSVECIELGPIGEAAAADLVRSRWPEASTAFVDCVYRAAEGNPELSLATGQLLERRGVPLDLTPSDPRAWSVLVPDPAEHDPVVDWLAGHGHERTRLWASLAAIGTDFDLADAAVAAGSSAADELRPFLDAAIEHRVIDGDDRCYWFRSLHIRSQLYRAMSSSDRRDVHARLAADLLGRRSGDNAAAMRLGHHLLAAGDVTSPARTVQALAAAGRAAAECRAWHEAGRFLEANLALVDEHHLGTAIAATEERVRLTERFDLLVEVGLAHYHNADYQGAVDRLTEAMHAAETLGDDAHYVKALVPLVRIETTYRPDHVPRSGARRRLHSFLFGARQPGPLARVLQARAESQVAAGHFDAAARHAERSLDLAIEADDPTAAALAGRTLGDAATIMAAPGIAAEHYRQALRTTNRADDRFPACTIETGLALARLVAGSLAGSRRLAESALLVASAGRDFTTTSLATAIIGMGSYLQGDFSHAGSHLADAAAEARRAGYPVTDLLVTPSEVLRRLATGDPTGAAEALDRWASPPRRTALALQAMVEGVEPEALRSTELGEMTDPALGAAVASALVAPAPPRNPGPELRLGERLELLTSAIDNGAELAVTLPVSYRRALATALSAGGEHEAALGYLEGAEERWRRERAFAELVEVLIISSAANATIGERQVSARQAGEAEALAERLGMTHARNRARHLLRGSEPKEGSTGEDLELMVVMSDVVGSTVVSSQAGDRAYFDLVMEHHQLVRRLLEDTGGTEFSEGGDSLFAWFGSPEDAMECALAIQAEASRQRRRGGRLSVRVGVAGGQPFFSQGRPYGSVVNRAARLTAKAEPDEVAVDELTLARMSPIITDFTMRSTDLRGFGRQTIGILKRGEA